MGPEEAAIIAKGKRILMRAYENDSHHLGWHLTNAHNALNRLFDGAALTQRQFRDLKDIAEFLNILS